MSIASRRAVALIAVAFLLVAGGLAALLLTNRREVTTSSSAAYEAYREAVANHRRFYLKEAQLGYARALALDPNFAMAMLRLSGLSNKDQAASLVERAARLRPRLNEIERLYIDLALADKAGSAAGRTKAARAIRERYPEDVDSAMYLAGDEMAQGHDEKALQIYSEMIANDPNNAGVYNLIGYYYGFRGDYDKAMEALKKYQFMAPDQANPYDSMGEVQAFSGRYDEAIVNLNKALALKPDFTESNGHLGVAYEGKGEYDKAIESYRKAAHEALTDGSRNEHLSQALRTALFTGNKAAARQALQEMADLPKDQRYEISRGYREACASLIDGRPAEAEKQLTEVRPKQEAAFLKEMKGSPYKPYFPQWNTLMAIAKVQQGKTEEALPLYEELANPPRPWASFEQRRWTYEGRARLAELVARKGDLDRAEKLIAENHRWNPSWAPSKPAELVVSQLRREKVLAATR